MNQEIFPAMTRLVNAFHEGNTSIKKIAEIFSTGEMEAAAPFQGAASGGGGGGGGGGSAGGQSEDLLKWPPQLQLPGFEKAIGWIVGGIKTGSKIVMQNASEAVTKNASQVFSKAEFAGNIIKLSSYVNETRINLGIEEPNQRRAALIVDGAYFVAKTYLTDALATKAAFAVAVAAVPLPVPGVNVLAGVFTGVTVKATSTIALDTFFKGTGLRDYMINQLSGFMDQSTTSQPSPALVVPI